MADKEYIERGALIEFVKQNTPHIDGDTTMQCVERAMKAAPAADVVEVVHGEWEWFEEWSPSTPDHPRECDDCGWRCGRCKNALADMVGGYWDDSWEKPKLGYCPECGAKMDGERKDIP